MFGSYSCWIAWLEGPEFVLAVFRSTSLLCIRVWEVVCAGDSNVFAGLLAVL